MCHGCFIRKVSVAALTKAFIVHQCNSVHPKW